MSVGVALEGLENYIRDAAKLYMTYSPTGILIRGIGSLAEQLPLPSGSSPIPGSPNINPLTTLHGRGVQDVTVNPIPESIAGTGPKPFVPSRPDFGGPRAHGVGSEQQRRAEARNIDRGLAYNEGGEVKGALNSLQDYLIRAAQTYAEINTTGQILRGLGSLVQNNFEPMPFDDLPSGPSLGSMSPISRQQKKPTPTKMPSFSRFEEGGEVLDKGIKPLFKAILKNGLEEGVADYLGIEEEDRSWASSIGDRYGLSPSKRDAARHVALGWLASKTDTPELAKFFADAREFRPIAGGPIVSRRMDLENNDIGYNLPAKDKNQAEIMILDLVEKGQVNTDDPSGYAAGGGVGSLAPVARNMYKIPSVKRGVGSYIPQMRR